MVVQEEPGAALRLLRTGRSADWGAIGSVLPVEISIDSVGRIVIPKPLRDALGLVPGSTLDISRYGAGLQLLPTGRTARLVDEAGVLVATGDTAIDDDVVFGLIDTGRRRPRSRWTRALRLRCSCQPTERMVLSLAGGMVRRSRSADVRWRKRTRPHAVAR